MSRIEAGTSRRRKPRLWLRHREGPIPASLSEKARRPCSRHLPAALLERVAVSVADAQHTSTIIYVYSSLEQASPGWAFLGQRNKCRPAAVPSSRFPRSSIVRGLYSACIQIRRQGRDIGLRLPQVARPKLAGTGRQLQHITNTCSGCCAAPYCWRPLRLFMHEQSTPLILSTPGFVLRHENSSDSVTPWPRVRRMTWAQSESGRERERATLWQQFDPAPCDAGAARRDCQPARNRRKLVQI